MKVKILFLLHCIFTQIDINYDPTTTPTFKKTTNIQHQLDLKCILITDELKTCLINDRFYIEGDNIKNFQINKINKEYIEVIDCNNNKIKLEVEEASWVESLKN